MSDERGKSYEGTPPAGAGAARERATAGDGEKRVALVIGNGAYAAEHDVLTNPGNDARSIAEALSRIGFFGVHAAGPDAFDVDFQRPGVEPLLDLNNERLGRALTALSRVADQTHQAVIYYAGHGIEDGRENYLIPVNAQLNHIKAIEDETKPLSRALRAIEEAKGLRLVIFDACRNNPFRARLFGERGGHTGLQPIEPPSNVLVAYSAKHGTTAWDGQKGGNSPFAAALLDHIETPGLEVMDLFREVKDDVIDATRPHLSTPQEPYLYGSLGRRREFFVAAVEEPPPDLDKLLWERIEGSNQIADYEFYLKKFPNGHRAAVAEYEIRRLQKEQAARDAVAELNLAYRTEFWKKNDAGKDLHRVFAWIEGDDDLLNRLEKVVFTLDPSFKDPVREITDRMSGFQLKTNAWGGFELKAVVHFGDTGVQKPLSCNIKFDTKPAAKPAPPSLPKTDGQFEANKTGERPPRTEETGELSTAKLRPLPPGIAASLAKLAGIDYDEPAAGGGGAAQDARSEAHTSDLLQRFRKVDGLSAEAPTKNYGSQNQKSKNSNSDDYIWYLARHGQQYGPVSLPEMVKLVQLGHLQDDDLVWNPQLAEWEPAEVHKPALLEKEKAYSYEVIVGDGTNDRTIRLAPGETAPKDAQFAPEMVLVPQGKFWMGSKDGEGSKRERPRHEVTIGYPLLVGKYPVTFDEWDAYVDAGGKSGGFLGVGAKHERHRPGDEGWGRGRRPVINVSWHDAQAYAQWLSETTGKTYRLLSEAEWEYACRAGTDTAYSFGDRIKCVGQYAWSAENSGCRTQLVGGKKPNPFGLYDMHGNVWEWCEDAWAGSYKGAPVDGSVRSSVDTSVPRIRICRGGSWNDLPKDFRSADRGWHYAIVRGARLSFRLARTLHP